MIGFVERYYSLDFKGAVEMLAKEYGISLEGAFRTSKDKDESYEINRQAAMFFFRALRERANSGYTYMKNRGISEDTMNRFGIGYADGEWRSLYDHLRQKGISEDKLLSLGLISKSKDRCFDKFRNRVIFPIMNTAGKVIGFGGRIIGEGEPKYLNSPETMIFDKSRNLYGLNFARSSRRPHILLCEGYMDVIALHQAGFDNAVASLGTSFTSGHANLLKRYTKEVYLTFDSDGAGVKAALRAIPILKEAGLTAKVINMRPYKDPDEFIKALGAEEYQKRIDEAENSFMFEVRMLERDYDLADPESKTKFFYAVARKILNFEEELERENYIEAVAAKYQIGFEQLRSVVRSEGTRGGLTRERERAPLKSGVNDRKKKEDGMKQSQRLFLTWLIEDERLFDLTEGYISPDDFTEEIFRDVAKVLYEQHAAGEINPAQIISRFTDEEQQREAAALFHARLHPVETRQEKEKALKETILRIKKNSMDVRSGKLEPTDLAGLQRLIEDKKQLAQLQKMHISLD